MIVLKTAEQIEVMARAGRVVGRTLDMVGTVIRPGMTTGQLDRLIEDFIRAEGAIPAFKGYQGFPASACISIDDEVVHGIPGKRVIEEGVIVSVDIGAIVDDYYGDSARTFGIGEVSEEKRRLMEWTLKALHAGIDKARKGNRLGAVSAAIQQVAESQGYGVVRQLVGHGIGRAMHEEPQVPNFGSPADGPVLEAGMVIAIEPMINMGTYEVRTLPDGWTVVTADGRPSAHFEHTVAVGPDGPRILTAA
ncbi:MAG TPA: type I methionyl aminopeptidase [candidate division Zixibacteria bacterium]|nr:type I methionyl aminopeptidase [candidate division Zixibacteria bacterium]MDD4918447.1 type I methionyl aminopeptidase [candidate division Zixibacteria bacterium]MDM7971774.1 type I methionyl aminopeptidase [candidate division Zixibacteria bacterium]HOZ08884.1 type I methionyl aminopeptidase [candidate division Zixibacteria bacterium]HPM37210.1 type I methionyl aminopeptidase [candidate division Zixibacteria bacterium]